MLKRPWHDCLIQRSICNRCDLCVRMLVKHMDIFGETTFFNSWPIDVVEALQLDRSLSICSLKKCESSSRPWAVEWNFGRC